MKRRLITVELLEDGQIRTLVRTAGLGMEKIGQIQAGITRAAVDLLRREKGFPEGHRESLEELVTRNYFKQLTSN